MSLDEIYSDPTRGLNMGAFISNAIAAGFSKKEAAEHYNKVATAQIHRKSKHMYHTIVAREGSWAIDLTFYPDYAGLPANRKKTAILVAIEQTSRYAWCRAIRTKSPNELAPLLAELIDEHHVDNIVTDNGSEWRGRVRELFEEHGVKHFATKRKGATARVERFNRTLREKIERWFTVSSTHSWVDILPKLVEAHNNTPSRVLLGYTPKQVIDDSQLSAEVRGYDAERGLKALKLRSDLPDQTKVRTALEKARFQKKSGAQWSDVVGTVEHDSNNRLLLRVRKVDGTLDPRRYAAWELQRVPDDTIEVKPRSATKIAHGAILNRVDPKSALQVDLMQVRKNKRVKFQLARESISSDNIIDRPRVRTAPQRYL